MFLRARYYLTQIVLFSCMGSIISGCVNGSDGGTATSAAFKQSPPKSTDPNRAGFDDNGLVYPMPPGYDSKGVFYDKNGNIRDVLPHMQPADYVDTYVSPYKKRDLQLTPKPTLIVLDEVPIVELDAASALAKSSIVYAVTAGIGRPVPQTANIETTKKLLTWHSTPSGGNIAAVNFTSKGADFVFVNLFIAKLPKSAVIRAYATNDTEAYTVSGESVHKNAARTGPYIVKTPPLQGKNIMYVLHLDAVLTKTLETRKNNVTVEIELPQNISPDEVEVAIPEITHSFFLSKASSNALEDPRMQGILVAGTGGSLACHADVSCQNPLPKTSNDVIKLSFKKDGTEFLCSGTLIADKSNSYTPFVLTAAHCIRTQASASSLQTHWFHRSSSCNAGNTTGFIRSENGNAILIAVDEKTDTALLQLGSPPPSGVTYTGWVSSISLSSFGEEVFGIHHPKGDPQKISTGTINGYFNLTGPVGLFSTSGILSSTFTNVSNIVGTTLLTEPGSSGSGLFKNVYFSHPQLVGVLSLAQQPATCWAENYAYFGRFDAAFPAFQPWLAPGWSPVKEKSTPYPHPAF